MCNEITRPHKFITLLQEQLNTRSDIRGVSLSLIEILRVETEQLMFHLTMRIK